MIKLKCVKPGINQDNKKRFRPGQVVMFSEMEASRHLAEGNANVIENQTITPNENRMLNATSKRDKNR